MVSNFSLKGELTITSSFKYHAPLMLVFYAAISCFHNSIFNKTYLSVQGYASPLYML